MDPTSNDFRRESRSGHDSEIKAWAAKTLPTLQDHLKQAQTTNRAVATSGTRKTRAKGTAGTKGENAPAQKNEPTKNPPEKK